MAKKKNNAQGGADGDGEGGESGEPKKKELKRPDPPKKVENPLPAMTEGMKKLSEMQVLVTKMVDELDLKRQQAYAEAVKAYEAQEEAKKNKEETDKKAAEIIFNAREVKRLKKKLASRPCKPEADLHPMGNPKIIDRVLALGAFEKPELLLFCSIAKAWVVPCRVKIFTNLSDLQVGSKSRLAGLLELFSAKPSLRQIVKSFTFGFQPSDPSAALEPALRECLPTTVQMIWLLQLCSNANALNFHNMAPFAANPSILREVGHRIEKVSIDPKGYAWHTRAVEFGHTVGPRGLFGHWPKLVEFSHARGILRIERPYSQNGSADDDEHTQSVCPLKKLTLEVIRLDGRLSHILAGAKGHLTHLVLVKVAVIQLGDLCRVLLRCGGSLVELKVIGCKLSDSGNDSDMEDGDDAHTGTWEGQDDNNMENDAWVSSGPKANDSSRKLGRFEKALGTCVNLTSLSIEPGAIPVETAPITLFKPLKKLETLMWNKRGISNIAPEVWLSMWGLGPVLTEQKRKMKTIRFGHDWNTDSRPVKMLKERWLAYSDKVEFLRLPN